MATAAACMVALLAAIEWTAKAALRKPLSPSSAACSPITIGQPSGTTNF
jgi:HAMP domain-containing protein